MKTISTTYRKRFDYACYHHQCITNWTAVIMVQVLIGHWREKRCEKQKREGLFRLWRSGEKHKQSHDSAGYVPMVMARDVMSEAWSSVTS